MRTAPAVSVRCQGGASWRLAQSGLYALAAAVLAAWSLAQSGFSPAWAIVPAAVCGALAWRLCAGGDVTLAWDGQRWTADGVPGALEVMLDLGSWLLLRLRPAVGRQRWIAVSQSGAGAALHGLRAAAYARPPRPAPGPGSGAEGG